jgi:F0F1-type ATP synthase delta subunit
VSDSMSEARTIANALLILLEEGIDQEKLIEETLLWLRSARKEKMLPSIILELERLESSNRKHNTLYIETPYDFTEKFLEEISMKLTGEKTTPREVVVNSDLIGGFLAKYKGVKIDGSLKRQLQEVSHNLYV